MTLDPEVARATPEILRSHVEQAWNDRRLLEQPHYKAVVSEVMARLNHGELRVAEKIDGAWKTHEWVKKAIVLFFPMSSMSIHKSGPFEWHDKVPIKSGLDRAGVRAVPGAIVRYSAFVEKGAVLMPSFVNVGARVGSGTMIDTWATVGSCAQVGRDCHVAGGVGIGGVLEPPAATPVIVEDHCFLGSRCIVVEGAIIEEGAVLGANVVVTATTHIIDVTQKEPVVYRGRVPANAVVIPGTRPKEFAGGTFGVPCALIIGRRSADTDRKTSLNSALRDYDVQA
ncbi:MAG: 2,3,4,5-tetrahydropyridine-2,6-dicarboxylate N-succinyltransferase [Planctomycetes bacterium]|nr:2,3,4,5-tetrahydropyridine-2,6-dicarboxylate N-succinyltransferase [Planctomycetota bacterium]